VHTDRSHGGELTPSQLAAAREFGLDFIAVTEHNTADTHAAFGEAGLLVIRGQETTTSDGHWLALGAAPASDTGLSGALAQVHRDGGLCVVAHPHAPYPSGTFRHSLDGFDLVEVWNGQWASDLPWNADNETALREWSGRLSTADPRPAIGSSDTHLAGQIGVPHTMVFASELTAPAILDGLRSGRSWIAGSAGVSLSLTASAGGSRARIGERLETGGAAVTVQLSLEGVPDGTVSLHTDRGAFPMSPGHEWRTTAAESRFVRAEVRHPDGRMAALTNLIVLA
jgi:hypothetical protein